MSVGSVLFGCGAVEREARLRIEVFDWRKLARRSLVGVFESVVCEKGEEVEKKGSPEIVRLSHRLNPIPQTVLRAQELQEELRVTESFHTTPVGTRRIPLATGRTLISLRG